MSNRKFFAFAVLVLSFGLIAESAQARSIRVDGGAWDPLGSSMADLVLGIGFEFDFLGAGGNTATISPNGRVIVSGGAETLQLFPLFDLDQTGGGNVASYFIEETNGDFDETGIDAGFRVTWGVRDSGGAVLNLFQLALWDFSDGSSGFEFGYDAITSASAASRIGYDAGLGGSFDLPGALGLTFADYQGIGAGLDGFATTCPNTPNAFACNNFLFSTMAFGPQASILPGIANGYFQIVDGNDIDVDGITDPAQGRHLFQGTAVMQVPEPTPLTLLTIGLLGLGLASRKKKV